MRCRHMIIAPLAMLAAAAPAQTRGDQWWQHVATIAADDMKGRLTGSPDYLRAAAYVIGQFEALGLKPAGTDGFYQPIDFVEQGIDQPASRVSLIDGATVTPLTAPDAIIFGGGGGPVPAKVQGELIFAGYGLHLPEAGYDDFAGLDLRGKIVVVVGGGPANISGALKSHARSERARYLATQGAIGVISLVTPKQVEIPWSRRKTLASQKAMYLADAGLRDVKSPLLSAQFDPDQTAMLFARSGHSFADVAALADASRPIAGFALNLSLSADPVATRRPLSSPNIVALLPGSDPRLAREYVVVSAHLDGLGVGDPIDGDTIYNGAMDNASGVANVIEIARRLTGGATRPRRSILFVLVCAEEKGLLGSHVFAVRPSVPRSAIVADLNFDMPLPLFPLKAVLALGEGESTLGAQVRAVAAARGLPVWADPLPDRNSFTRSDQYSWVRAGVPALAFKFGFERGTPEEQIEKTWRATRYHAPSDDLGQPVEKEEAVKLNDFVADVALRVANDPQRPSWLATSFFKRFAQ